MPASIRYPAGVMLLFTGACLAAPQRSHSQNPLETPLEQEVLTLLTNEISGKIAFNNLVKLAGAPWLRNPSGFTDTFYESGELHRMVLNYGIETVRFDRYEGPGTFTYATDGELWILEPERRLVAWLGADVARLAYGSRSTKYEVRRGKYEV